MNNEELVKMTPEKIMGTDNWMDGISIMSSEEKQGRGSRISECKERVSSFFTEPEEWPSEEEFNLLDDGVVMAEVADLCCHDMKDGFKVEVDGGESDIISSSKFCLEKDESGIDRICSHPIAGQYIKNRLESSISIEYRDECPSCKHGLSGDISLRSFPSQIIKVTDEMERCFASNKNAQSFFRRGLIKICSDEDIKEHEKFCRDEAERVRLDGSADMCDTADFLDGIMSEIVGTPHFEELETALKNKYPIAHNMYEKEFSGKYSSFIDFHCKEKKGLYLKDCRSEVFKMANSIRYKDAAEKYKKKMDLMRANKSGIVEDAISAYSSEDKDGSSVVTGVLSDNLKKIFSAGSAINRFEADDRSYDFEDVEISDSHESLQAFSRDDLKLLNYFQSSALDCVKLNENDESDIDFSIHIKKINNVTLIKTRSPRRSGKTFLSKVIAKTKGSGTVVLTSTYEQAQEMRVSCDNSFPAINFLSENSDYKLDIDYSSVEMIVFDDCESAFSSTMTSVDGMIESGRFPNLKLVAVVS